MESLRRLYQAPMPNSPKMAMVSVAIIVFSLPLHAENEICLPRKLENGYTVSAMATAKYHSYENAKDGVIAVSAMPGKDLHNSPENLTKTFRKNGLPSDCFINNSMFPTSGTEISLYVAGSRVEYEGRTTFSITELRENPEILRNAKRDSLIAKAAYGK